MNQYRDLYKRNGLLSSSDAEKRSNDRNNRKVKRNQNFDVWRETDVIEPKDKDVEPAKNTKKKLYKENSNNRWRNTKKKADVKKQSLPFVVGKVRHKIYSPPFLHGPLKMTEPRIKSGTTLQQSFAPRNHKFNAPTGLAINILTPSKGNYQSSPFTLQYLLGKSNEKSGKKKEQCFENITVRPRTKKLYVSPLRSTAKSAAVEKDVSIDGQKHVRRQLYPEVPDEQPIFGRLNLEMHLQKSKQNLSKETDLEIQKSETENQKIIKEITCSLEKFPFSPPQVFSSQKFSNKMTDSPVFEKVRFTELDLDKQNEHTDNNISQMPSLNLSEINYSSVNSRKSNNEEMNPIKWTTPKVVNGINRQSSPCRSPIILQKCQESIYNSPQCDKIKLAQTTLDIENESLNTSGNATSDPTGITVVENGENVELEGNEIICEIRVNSLLDTSSITSPEDTESITNLAQSVKPTPVEKSMNKTISLDTGRTADKVTPLKQKCGMHIGTAKSCAVSQPEIIITLLDSPEVGDKKYSPLKSQESNACAGDYKSPIVFPKYPKNVYNSSQLDKSQIIDLVSDDEEDYTTYLSKVLAKYSSTNITSPKSNHRTAMASVENVPKIHISPCQSSRTSLHSKENSPLQIQSQSPLRVLCLRNRKVGISPSPKKLTPRRRKKEDNQRM